MSVWQFRTDSSVAMLMTGPPSDMIDQSRVVATKLALHEIGTVITSCAGGGLGKSLQSQTVVLPKAAGGCTKEVMRAESVVNASITESVAMFDQPKGIRSSRGRLGAGPGPG